MRNESEYQNRVYLTTAKYNNMNSTQHYHYLHYLICNTLRFATNVVKVEINVVGVRLARSCALYWGTNSN